MRQQPVSLCTDRCGRPPAHAAQLGGRRRRDSEPSREILGTDRNRHRLELPRHSINPTCRDPESKQLLRSACAHVEHSTLFAFIICKPFTHRTCVGSHALYVGASDETRRKLNQAIFKHIFVANEEVVGDEINSPLAELLAAQHGFRARAAGLNKGDSLDQALAELLRHTAPTTRATAKDGSHAVTVEDLLTGIDADADSSKPSMVGPTGLEPMTPAV